MDVVFRYGTWDDVTYAASVLSDVPTDEEAGALRTFIEAPTGKGLATMAAELGERARMMDFSRTPGSDANLLTMRHRLVCMLIAIDCANAHGISTAEAAGGRSWLGDLARRWDAADLGEALDQLDERCLPAAGRRPLSIQQPTANAFTKSR